LERKWATFTYTAKETRKITKLLKEVQVTIGLGTRNGIENEVKLQSHKQIGQK
jgi:hypothetical protein